MADAKQCDRCGSFFGINEIYKGSKHIFDKPKIPPKNLVKEEEYAKEICPGCQMQLDTWWNEPTAMLDIKISIPSTKKPAKKSKKPGKRRRQTKEQKPTLGMKQSKRQELAHVIHKKYPDLKYSEAVKHGRKLLKQQGYGVPIDEMDIPMPSMITIPKQDKKAKIAALAKIIRERDHDISRYLSLKKAEKILNGYPKNVDVRKIPLKGIGSPKKKEESKETFLCPMCPDDDKNEVEHEDEWCDECSEKYEGKIEDLSLGTK